VSVIWHDLECGAYAQDLPLWRELAAQHGDPVLEIGAGTGRVTLELARAGHSVTAVDVDDLLLAELERRAAGLDVTTVVADARAFELGRRFPLCIVPMQTIQLLGGGEGRAAFLRCARRHLVDAGVLAIAIAAQLELFDTGDGTVALLPDICERDGMVYCSRPTAVRAQAGGYVLERERQMVTADGTVSTELDLIRLDRIDSGLLEREAAALDLHPSRRARIDATEDHVASAVVILHA
jgi:SAM-dependent methyltransferase